VTHRQVIELPQLELPSSRTVCQYSSTCDRSKSITAAVTPAHVRFHPTTPVFRLRDSNWHTTPLWANGEAGFAAYAAGTLHTVQILTVDAGRVNRTTVYQDERVFDLFSLPP
jgi:hypothetical protein